MQRSLSPVYRCRARCDSERAVGRLLTASADEAFTSLVAYSSSQRQQQQQQQQRWWCWRRRRSINGTRQRGLACLTHNIDSWAGRHPRSHSGRTCALRGFHSSRPGLCKVSNFALYHPQRNDNASWKWSIIAVMTNFAKLSVVLLVSGLEKPRSFRRKVFLGF